MRNDLTDLLDDLVIDYTYEPPEVIITTAQVSIMEQGNGWYRIYGAGYSGTWEYSAEYVAKMLDRKFIENLLEERET